MSAGTHFWNKFYPFALPLIALIVFRDATVDYYFGWAESFRRAFQSHLTAWMLWLMIAPGVAWVFQRNPLRPLRRSIPVLLLLAFSAAVLQTWLHHVLMDSVVTAFRIGWGALTVSMLLAFLSALRLQDERRIAEIHASNLEKHLEEARLEDIRARVDHERVVSHLQEARRCAGSDPLRADQILSELADRLRCALKSIEDKLKQARISGGRVPPKKHRTARWILYSTRLADDLYVWNRPPNWNGYLLDEPPLSHRSLP